MYRLLFSVAICTIALWAQFDSGQISGYIRDSSGAIIPGAPVVVTNDATNVSQRATSNDQGFYIFVTLPIGTYRVGVEANGFKRYQQTNIVVNAAGKAAVDVELAVGALTDTVEVRATGAQVNTESAQVGRVVESKQIQDLTLNGRNPIYLALLKPGVRGGNINTFDPDSVSNGGFSINGGRSDEYFVYVDGAVATRTRSSGSMLGSLNVDAVQEVQILTANYSAEFGRSSGGQIRFVTKSGTKDFHGDLVENFRNSALDANSWQRNRSPDPAQNRAAAPFRFNQFGYDIGGPVIVPGKFNQKRDKMFFFWAQEYIKRRNVPTNTGAVPTLAMRRGDLSELLNPANPFFGRARAINDPDTRAPFPNNTIPSSRISPNGRALLNVFPEPVAGFQQGTSNWIGVGSAASNMRKDTVKIDYLFNEKHRLAFSGSYNPWTFNVPFSDTFGRVQELWERPNRLASMSLTSTLSPTLINELNVSANSDGKGVIDWRDCPTCRRSAFGVNYPLLFPGTKAAPEKVPSIRIQGLTTLDGGPYPGAWAGYVYALSNNTTKIYSRHTVKFGVFVERSGQNDFIQGTTAGPGTTNNQNGDFSFSDSGGHPLTSSLALGNVLLGYFDSYSEFGTKAYTPYAATSVDFFAQDSWKVTPKLTFEYGIRYSLWPPWSSRWGNISMFHPDFYDPKNAAVIDRAQGFVVSGDRYNGIVLPGTSVPSAEGGRVAAFRSKEFDRLRHNLPNGFSPTYKNLWQPRLGLAYALTPKTALRAGLGRFYNRTMINRDTALGANPPFQLQQGVFFGNVDTPGGATRRDFPFAMTIQDPVLRVPEAWMWNATFERELPGAIRVEAGYVARRGLYNQRKRNINQLPTGTIQSNPGVNPNFLRPYLGYGIVGISENSGTSRYDGLQLSVERRFSRGFQFGGAYTLSRTLDDASSLTEVLPNAYDTRGYYTHSDNDRRHVLIFNYIYEIPVFNNGRRLVKSMLGGWELSGVNQFQSGGPFSVREGVDYAGVGPGSGTQFWRVTSNPNQVERTPFNNFATWFDRAAFARPDQRTFAPSSVRNSLYNPGFYTWDLGLRKNFAVTDKQRLQFRWEVFNVLNHPNWGGATNNPVSAAFGQVTAKTGERQLQLALKYIF